MGIIGKSKRIMHAKPLNYLILASAVAFVIFISGCVDNDIGSITCPVMSGDKLCGYCSEDAALSDNPHAGKCRYCPTGTACIMDDICGELSCRQSGSNGGNGGTSGGGGGKTYYASCSSCDGPYRTYSYRGADYTTCNYYYQLCVAASCDKILDNCR